MANRAYKDPKDKNSPSLESATVLAPNKSVRKYNREDLVDIYLLYQIAQYVKHDKLESLARDLKIEKTVYAQLQSPDDKIWKVGRLVPISSKRDQLPFFKSTTVSKATALHVKSQKNRSFLIFSP